MKKNCRLSYFKAYRYRRATGQGVFSRLCMAPFTNLLFVPSGKVMACHYNRGTVLGDISKDTIKDIWNGKTIKDLRKYISASDMSYGCQACFNDIYAGNYFLAGNYKYMHTRENKSGYPSYFDFQIENTCNLKCLMCSSEYSSAIQGKENSVNPYNDKFISQLPEFIPHLYSSSFTGGEPFIIRSYFRIWEMFREINPDAPLFISTNASHISSQLKEILEKGNFRFTVSIDSLKPEIYESIRVNASFGKTMNNIDYLQDLTRERKNGVSIKMVIMTNNYSELPDQIEYWSSRNTEVFPKLVWVPVSMSLRSLSSEDLERVILSYRKHIFKGDSIVLKNNISRFGSLINQLVHWKNDREMYSSRKMLEKKSIGEVTDILSGMLNNAVAGDFNTGIEEKALLSDKCEKWVESVKMTNSGDKDKLKKNIIGFILLGPDILIAEIKRNPEKLTERFNMDINLNG